MSVKCGLVEDDYVIQALSPDRADDAFHKRTFPGRPGSRKDLLDPHSLHVSAEMTMVYRRLATRGRNRCEGVELGLRMCPISRVGYSCGGNRSSVRRRLGERCLWNNLLYRHRRLT